MTRRAARRLLLLATLAATAGAAAPRSGYTDASPPIQHMQDDDASNPAFLWVQQGETLYAEAPPGGPSCQSCHGPAAKLRGVATRFPRFDPALQRPVTLSQQIDMCRTQRQHAPSFPPESDEALALTAYVGLQSRGVPMAVDATGPAAASAAHGRSLFETRMGQLNLSCAQCHDGLAGQRLAGALIPQGQPNAYPLYRLEWQSLGSLERRLRNCLTGVRAEPLANGSRDLADLEFFLAVRSNGLAVETPGVRP